MLGLPIGISVLCPGSTDTNVMESERVRPASLGAEQPQATWPKACAATSRTRSPDRPARRRTRSPTRVLEAIRDDEFWIIPHPWERPVFEARFDDVLAHYPTEAPGGATLSG